MGEVSPHSSWRGIAASFGGAATILALGVLGLAVGGGAVLPLVLMAAGVLFVLFALLDYPLESTFTADGVERRWCCAASSSRGIESAA